MITSVTKSVLSVGLLSVIFGANVWQSPSLFIKPNVKLDVAVKRSSENNLLH